MQKKLPKYKKIFLEEYVPYPVDIVYDVVANVEDYPLFLPGCADITRLSPDSDGRANVSMTIRKGKLSLEYVSKVSFLPDSHTVIAEADPKPPLEHLTASWSLRPKGVGTHIHFQLNFALRTGLGLLPIGSLIREGMRDITRAFVARAKTLAEDESYEPKKHQNAESGQNIVRHDADETFETSFNDVNGPRLNDIHHTKQSKGEE